MAVAMWDRLNESQRAGLDISRHMGMTAAAGTGKTTALVARFVKALEASGFRPERIVAITFTIKAATEMRQRVSEQILRDARQAENSGDPDTAAKLRRAREELPSARIDTIHGFCASLLREYPFQAGVDPNFDIVEGVDEASLKRETIESTLDSIASNPEGSRQHDALACLLSEWRRKTIIRLLEELMARGRKAREWAHQMVSATPDAVRKLHSDKIGELKIALQSGERPPKDNKTDEGSLNRAIELMKALAAIYVSVDDAITIKKQEANVLGFDDLLILASGLLGDETVAKRVRSGMDHLLVDESQDTDPIQWDIIFRISPKDINGPKLFAVGDENQSIYRFRGADVTAFNLVKEAIKARNLKLDADNDKPDIVEMSDNLRSAPGLIDFFNALFSNIFGQDRYQKMICSQEASDYDHPGHIELIVAGNSDKTPLPEALEPEARTIAGRIREMCQNFNVTLRSEGANAGMQRRRAQYKDFGLLIRQRTHLEVLESALREHGIPYIVHEGKGFYENQEIKDIANVLSFLADPRDDIALAGVLRSPLFGLKDSSLLWISGLEGEFFGDKLEAAAGNVTTPEHISDKDALLIKLAWDRFSRWAGLKNRISNTELIRRISEESGQPASFGVSQRPLQEHANLKKLLNISRDPHLSLGDLAEKLKFLVESNAREGEAALVSHDLDAVKIMTIHAAKGLEFPIVIVPFTGLSFQTDKAKLMTGEGLALPKYVQEKDLKTPLKPLLKELESRRSKDESRRLLYVAFTRAQNALIISGTQNPKSKQADWLSWIMDCLEIEGPVAQVKGSEVKTELKSIIQVKGSEVKIELRDAVKLSKPDPDDTDEKIIGLAAKARSLRPVSLPARVTDETGADIIIPITGSSVQTLINDPAGYLLTTTESVSNDITANELPLIRGRIIHKIFEKLVPGDELEHAVRRFALIEGLFDENEIMKIANRARKALKQFEASDAKKLLEKSTERLNEFAFKMNLKNSIVTGAIDVAFLDPGNELWHVMDYKTDDVKGDLEEHIQEKGYENQVKLYALALKKLFRPKSGVKGHIYFTETGKTVQIAFSEPDLERFEQNLADSVEKARHNTGRYRPIAQ